MNWKKTDFVEELINQIKNLIELEEKVNIQYIIEKIKEIVVKRNALFEKIGK